LGQSEWSGADHALSSGRGTIRLRDLLIAWVGPLWCRAAWKFDHFDDGQRRFNSGALSATDSPLV